MRIIRLSLFLFAAVYIAVLLFKFWGLLSVSEILPGGDTASHFVALREFIDGLRQGNFFNYFKDWFGGQPLFHFYPPLSFLLMGGSYLLFGEALSIFFIFRFFIFLTFAIFPISFYFFLKEFLGPKVARIGIWLSFLWVLYPKIPASIGAGASGAVFYGLFSQVLAVSFFLWYLVVLKRIFESQRFRFPLIIGGTAALTLIFLTHSLTTFAAGFITIFFALYHWRSLFKLRTGGAILMFSLLAFLLSSFWLVPFLAQFGYTSAERIDFSGYFPSALIPFLQFDLSDFVRGEWTTFYYVWFAAAVLFVLGVVKLVRQRQYFLLTAFAVMFLFFNLDYLSKVVLPAFPLHYYRLVTYQIVFYLAVAAVGLKEMVRLVPAKNFWPRFGLVLAAISLIHYIVLYDFSGRERAFNTKPLLNNLPFDFPYHWSIREFGLAGFGKRAVDFLKNEPLPERPQRVLSDVNILTMVGGLSSIHYFNTFIPLINDQEVIIGLYAESAWQVPFIFPATNFITGNEVKWGRVRDLYFNSQFKSQDIETMVERVRLFGVNYLVMTSNSFEERFPEGAAGIRFVEDFGPIRIYQIEGARPFVYEPVYKPGLFVADKADEFREFALGWYSLPEILDKPVAWWQNGLKNLTKETVVPFSFLIVRTDEAGPSEAEANFLLSLEKPILFVHRGDTLNLDDAGRQIAEASDFRPVAGYYSPSGFLDQPNVATLQTLKDFVARHAVKNDNVQPVELAQWSDNEVIFSGQGPVIVNLGYFPYWQQPDGEKVYPVTPGQMLVFADGETELVYQPGADAKIGRRISLITLIALIGLAVLRFSGRLWLRRQNTP